MGAAAPDAPFAAPGAAIPVKGRHPHQGGDLPAAKVPQFRQPGHYAQGGLRTHPGDTAQELVLIQPDGITPKEVVDIPVQLPKLLFQGLQGRLDTLLNPGEVAYVEPILFHLDHLQELPPPGHEMLELLLLGIRQRPGLPDTTGLN